MVHGEYSRSSQSSSSLGLGESGDASKAVSSKEPKTLPPSKKFRPQGTYMPPGKRAVAEVVQREPKARAPTNSSPKVRSGPTVSTAFVPPPPDSYYIPNRRNDITNGDRGPPDPPYKGYQQNPTARPPQPANPGIKTEKPSDPLLVETQRTRPSLGFVKTLEDIPPVSDRRLPNKLRHSKSLGDNLIQGNVSSPERHPESFNTPEDVPPPKPHAESLKTPEVTPPKPHPESVKILEEVTPPQLHPDTTKIPADYAAPKRHSSNSPQLPNSSSDRNPEPVIEHLNIFNNPQLADDSSSSAGGVMLDESLVTPTDSKDDSSMPIVKLPESLELEGSKNPALEDGSRAGSSCSTPVARSTSASIDNEAFYHQFHDINTLLDEPPVSIIENSAEDFIIQLTIN